MKLFLPFFLLFSASVIASTNSNQPEDSLKIILDSLFAETKVDTSQIANIYLCADIMDKGDYNLKFKGNHISCTDYPIFIPILDNCFITKEYDQLILNDPKKNEDLFFNFIEDNMIDFSLNKVYVDSNNTPIKIERLSTEVHVDFGEIISTSYFKDGKLKYYHNDYCRNKFNEKKYNFFEYENGGVISEKEVVLNENRITIQYWTAEDKWDLNDD